jgi:hypothetical protein
MFSRSFCGTRTIVSENQYFLVLGSLDSVETECAYNKMGEGRKGFMHVFFYGPRKLSHRHGAFLHRQGQIDMLPFTQVSRHVLCSPFE